MAKDRSDSGDPSRTLELLWRETGGDGKAVGRSGARTRGPRQGLSVDAVVGAAIVVADAEGLDAVTMRRVAQHLSVTPMTLYTYVPGKAELLDLMLDAVYLRMERPEVTGGSWRERVSAVAHENLALFVRHSWVSALPLSRPPLGPGLMAKYEHELNAFEGLGLGDVQQDLALSHVLAFVQSIARKAHDAAAVERESAMSDEQWWEANAPLLARVFDPERYPVATRVGSAAGEAYQGLHSPDRDYEFGLALILDGLERLIGE